MKISTIKLLFAASWQIFEKTETILIPFKNIKIETKE